MRNLKVMMSYRGTNYHGFQIQNNAHTVQAETEKALSSVLNEKVTMNGCSRTDAGVHANEYCFSVNTSSKINTKGFVRGMNGLLPDDISILSCEDVDENFHARFSCKGKEYVYKIHNSESKNPFMTDLAYHYRRKLDVDLIRETAKYFIGTHNFKSFCSSDCDKENTIRTIYDFRIEKNNDMVEMYVSGDGFLYNMVRIMVGTLLTVNEGFIKPEEIIQIMDMKDRRFAGKTAQAHGLYLNKVFYQMSGGINVE